MSSRRYEWGKSKDIIFQTVFVFKSETCCNLVILNRDRKKEIS